MDALVDLTGGLAERFDLAEHDQGYLFRHLYKSTAAGAFITCSRKVSEVPQREVVVVPPRQPLGSPVSQRLQMAAEAR